MCPSGGSSILHNDFVKTDIVPTNSCQVMDALL